MRTFHLRYYIWLPSLGFIKKGSRYLYPLQPEVSLISEKSCIDISTKYGMMVFVMVKIWKCYLQPRLGDYAVWVICFVCQWHPFVIASDCSMRFKTIPVVLLNYERMTTNEYLKRRWTWLSSKLYLWATKCLWWTPTELVRHVEVNLVFVSFGFQNRDELMSMLMSMDWRSDLRTFVTLTIQAWNSLLLYLCGCHFGLHILSRKTNPS